VFGAALLAATILPFASEFTVGAAIAGGVPAFGVWLAASVGNTLGAVVNGLLGRLLSGEQVRARLHVSESAYARAMRWYRRWGVWSLLLAWLPVVGDALTVVGGALRVRWWWFVTLVFIGKAGRYAVLIALLRQAGV
jgi:membrane protein YqaA with SNARE-associated domain